MPFYLQLVTPARATQRLGEPIKSSKRSLELSKTAWALNVLRWEAAENTKPGRRAGDQKHAYVVEEERGREFY